MAFDVDGSLLRGSEQILWGGVLMEEVVCRDFYLHIDISRMTVLFDTITNIGDGSTYEAPVETTKMPPSW